MATVKQDVSYEITAQDKTAQATDSVMKRIDEMREKEKAAAKERKAESEQNQKQLQKSKGMMQALGAAASGSWSAVAKSLATAVAGTKALNSAMMKFGPYAAIIAAAVGFVKALATWLSAAKERAEKIQFDNIKSGLESSKKQAEAFNAALDATKAKQEAASDALVRQLDAIKALKDAQDDYNKALDLSLAKTDEERRKIEEKYRILKEASSEENDAAKRQAARDRSDDKIADLEARLANLRQTREDATRTATKMTARSAANAQNIGVWDNIKNWFTGGRTAADKSAEQGELAQNAWAEAKTTEQEIQKLETELEAERRNRKLLDQEETKTYYELATKDVTRKEEKADEKTEKTLDDYARWKASGSTDKFDVWKKKDDKAKKENVKLRTKQYREWLKEMGRDAPDEVDVGGTAFKRFSEMKDKEDKERAAAEEQRRVEEAKTRETKKAEEERERIKKQKADASAAYQIAKDAEAAANARLAAAKAAVSQAWGWYRDKDSMKAQLEEEKADAAARQQYEKDFEKLSFRRDWRTAKNLSVDQEAVRRVALAKEEETAAQKAVLETAENTARSAKALESIEAVFTEGGE
ncbi:MAG: hypothetical protein IKO72_08645 [Kiritimatiellae bacterium]|nr:hypothetical protein [Kiritimatiellia bacterium]